MKHIEYYNKFFDNVYFNDMPSSCIIEYSNISECLDGWKISIQGKSKEDAIFLLKKLYPYLNKNKIYFKVGIKRRINLINNTNIRDKEQGHKIMTIYSTNQIDFKNLCKDIYDLTKDYKGWYDVKTPTSYEHYAGGLFIRNDRDKNGNYIRAN